MHYIFVRLLVLGEQVKEHRRRVIVVGNGREAVMVRSCHISVWDVVFGLAKDGKGAGGGGGGGGTKMKCKEDEEEEKVDAGGGGGGGGGGVSWGCRGYLRAILRSADCSRTERDVPMLLDGATMHSNYINIKSTLYAYLIATQEVPRKLHGNTLIHQIST